jgi:uncharacterized RmlC-like cupin family protein
MGMGEKMDWKEHGLRIIRSDALDTNTLQTLGMTRAEAISRARVGAQKLWAGTVVVHPNAKTGPHHHGELETVIYIVRGRRAFVGESDWSLWTKRDRGISCTCHRMCRTRS